jgi:MoxR-like ATPase
MHERAFVMPEDVQQMAVAVLAHRLTLNTKAKYDGTDKNAVVNAVLESVKVPV